MRKNKHLIEGFIFFGLLASPLFSEPEIFTRYLPVDGFVKGQSGMVLPPQEIEPYVKKVEAAALKNQKWFEEFSKNSKPGVPLPFHENLGLTKKEYAQYKTIWAKRLFKPSQPVALRLEKSADGDWMISATGPGFPISSLRYDEEKNQLKSPNGLMKQIQDIKGDKESLLGSWAGQEWKHESETTISKTMENFAIGKKANEAIGYIVYRLKEVSNTGRNLYDRRIIIQFPIQK